ILAHDHDVHVRMLGLNKRMIRNAGSYVGIEPERFAHRDVEALVTAALWSCDRGLEKNFGSAQGVPRAGIDARSISGEIDLLANVYFFDIQFRARLFQDIQRGFHDFRADAVAVGDRDWYGGHNKKCLSFCFEKLTNISQKPGVSNARRTSG